MHILWIWHLSWCVLCDLSACLCGFPAPLTQCFGNSQWGQVLLSLPHNYLKMYERKNVKQLQQSILIKSGDKDRCNVSWHPCPCAINTFYEGGPGAKTFMNMHYDYWSHSIHIKEHLWHHHITGAQKWKPKFSSFLLKIDIKQNYSLSFWSALMKHWGLLNSNITEKSCLHFLWICQFRKTVKTTNKIK